MSPLERLIAASVVLDARLPPHGRWKSQMFPSLPPDSEALNEWRDALRVVVDGQLFDAGPQGLH